MSFRPRRSYAGRTRSYGRSRSARRTVRPVTSLIKRARTRAYANLRTGGILAIERKFSDCATAYDTLGVCTGGVNDGAASTFAPPVISAVVYRDAVGVIHHPVNWAALNILAPGDSGSDRDGRQVINDSIHIRGYIEYANAALESALNVGACVNIVLVLDTQTNGNGPTGGQVFVNPGDFTGMGNLAAVNPFLNLANSKRFRILKHVRRYVSPSSFTTSNVPQGGFVISMDVPLKGMKTNYVTDAASASAATVASIGDNGIFLFMWSDVSNAFKFQVNSRLRFRG